MIVCHMHGLVYLAPPKTGSANLRHLLMHEPFHGRILGEHAHHGVEWNDDFKDYFHFITVRHPFPRMYSLWRFLFNGHQRYKAAPGERSPHLWFVEYFPDNAPCFDEFLDATFLPFRDVWRCSWQLEQLPSEVAGTVVKLESYYQDLARVPHVRDHLDSVGYFNVRSDDAPPWYEVINAARAKKIRELWAEDFVRFGYNTTLKSAISLQGER